MRKLKIYLDTSVPSAYYDESNKNRCEITKKWWDEKLFQENEVYISEIALMEISRTKNEVLRNKLKTLVKAAQRLVVVEGTIELAKAYIKQGIIPKDYYDDALHISLAAISGMDVIVSWNFKHMVNLATRRQVRAINILNGYNEIDIVSPEELGGYKNE